MFNQTFSFLPNKENSSFIPVSKDTLFNEELGYGFVTEENRANNKSLQIAEINSAFDVPFWYQGHKLTSIEQDLFGCFLSNRENIPLTFKCSVPNRGNYNVTICIKTNEQPLKNIMIFTGRRRLAFMGTIGSNETFKKTFTVNVSNIIPRGFQEVFTDLTIDITVLGLNPRITSLKVEEISCPTLYIAGDSTVTDQGGTYPYKPEHCYSGWGQMLSLYMLPNISLSNHAHSGLTTESFRSEGHYDIVLEAIKPGDYFLMQFAHNDQKLAHLTSDGGYRTNILHYIDEIRNLGAYPIIVTPLARNTWKGNDGSYNDLLDAYAKECIKIGLETNVPVIDLHKRSLDFIIAHGLEQSKPYFYPDDYTHTNDYGACVMARFVAEECIKTCTDTIFKPLISHLIPCNYSFYPPATISNPTPPSHLNVSLEHSPVFSNVERPNDNATRVDALDFIIKSIGFFPTNVYNDMFTDVIGHEWFAGTVECAYQNGMIDQALIMDNQFFPLEEVTLEVFISLLINALKSRQKLPVPVSCGLEKKASNWCIPYIQLAIQLGFIDNNADLQRVLTRGEVAQLASKLR